MPTLPLIIEPEQLNSLINNEQHLIVDIRKLADYQHAHIPGAVHADLSPFNAKAPPTVGLLPDIDTFNQTVSALGLQNGQTLVVYDEKAGPPAGRFVWTMQAFGHNAVSLLNGGFQAWQASGGPTSTLSNSPQSSHYQAKPNAALHVDKAYILQHLSDPHVTLIDARTAAEFSGEDKRSEHGGHIPGAINLNWQDTKATNNSAKFKSNDELQTLLQTLNIANDQEIICYCQSHQRSALLCVLLESLGFKNIKGYPGAWSDWGNQTNTPIES